MIREVPHDMIPSIIFSHLGQEARIIKAEFNNVLENYAVYAFDGPSLIKATTNIRHKTR